LGLLEQAESASKNDADNAAFLNNVVFINR
jgi:hypothetical protein